MTDEEKLQKYLPLIRDAAGWTAEDLGNKIGVTKQTISNLEKQKTKMSKTQYLAIQMVISQKIATTPNDSTLANIMKLAMNTDEESPINYDAVPKAIEVVKHLDSGTYGVIDTSTPHQTEQITSTQTVSGTALGTAAGSAAAGSIAGAIGMLGLGPVGAISAAVLGATIAPWLTKALDIDDDKSKEEKK